MFINMSFIILIYRVVLWAQTKGTFLVVDWKACCNCRHVAVKCCPYHRHSAVNVIVTVPDDGNSWYHHVFTLESHRVQLQIQQYKLVGPRKTPRSKRRWKDYFEKNFKL
jgi:hypothetical protein